MLKPRVKYNGLRTKTINIQVTAGSTKFYLQQNNDLGIPKNAPVLGIITRDHYDTGIASNRQQMVKSIVYENSYLNLKVMEKGGINLLASNYYLPFSSGRALFTEPTLSQFIDWNESFIQINKRAAADVQDLHVIELVVLYAENNPKLITNLPITFELNVGEKLNGIRVSHIERSINTIQSIYPLSNTTNIGIPRTAYIVGFSVMQTYNPLFGETMDANTLVSTYFTLKRGTDAFIELLPVYLNTAPQYLLFPFLDYIPIEPVPVLEIDWNSSNFQINDLTLAANNQVFQFDLYWVNGPDQLNTVE